MVEEKEVVVTEAMSDQKSTTQAICIQSGSVRICQKISLTTKSEKFSLNSVKSETYFCQKIMIPKKFEDSGSSGLSRKRTKTMHSSQKI